MKDFLFRNVSKEERESIKEEAKEITESFTKNLESVKDLPSEISEQKESFYREEKPRKENKTNFKEKILENAPRKNKDFILSEKKKW